MAVRFVASFSFFFYRPYCTLRDSSREILWTEAQLLSSLSSMDNAKTKGRGEGRGLASPFSLSRQGFTTLRWHTRQNAYPGMLFHPFFFFFTGWLIVWKAREKRSRAPSRNPRDNERGTREECPDVFLAIMWSICLLGCLRVHRSGLMHRKYPFAGSVLTQSWLPFPVFFPFFFFQRAEIAKTRIIAPIEFFNDSLNFKETNISLSIIYI